MTVVMDFVQYELWVDVPVVILITYAGFYSHDLTSPSRQPHYHDYYLSLTCAHDRREMTRYKALDCSIVT